MIMVSLSLFFRDGFFVKESSLLRPLKNDSIWISCAH